MHVSQFKITTCYRLNCTCHLEVKKCYTLADHKGSTLLKMLLTFHNGT